MKTYQLDNRPHNLYFTDYERLGDEVTFDKVMNGLIQCNDVLIIEKKIGPSEDYYICALGDSKFTLALDISEGVGVYSDDQGTMLKLIELFNNI